MSQNEKYSLKTLKLNKFHVNLWLKGVCVWGGGVELSPTAVVVKNNSHYWFIFIMFFKFSGRSKISQMEGANL